MIRLLTAAMLLIPACALAESDIDRLDALMQGVFESVDAEDPFRDKRVRVHAPGIGEYVYYYQVNSGPEMKVYRQRLLVLEADPESGEILQHAWSLKEPEQKIDAAADDFAEFTVDDIEPTMDDGCEQVWQPADDGFRGYVDPKRCVIISSRTGKPRGIEAESVLTSESLQLAERGYDENGEQLFGTPPGELFFLKRIDD